MEALNLGLIENVRPLRTAEPSARVDKSAMRLVPRINAALMLLLEAHDYGQDLDQSTWDFAIEIASMRRLKLTNSDLRWLVGRGLVEHAIEATMAGDVDRSFRQSARLLFFKRTCFVITPRGAELARQICKMDAPAHSSKGLPMVDRPALFLGAADGPLAPNWDRDRQELRIGSIVVKQFKVPASNQETILAAFEEESWPPRIDDPLPPHPEQSPKRRLQETIKSLNRNQKRSLLRFLGDGSGQGVRWEFRSDRDAPRQA
jgi:hypothetical protein